MQRHFHFLINDEVGKKARGDMAPEGFTSLGAWTRHVLMAYRGPGAIRVWTDGELMDFARTFADMEAESVLFGTKQQRIEKALDNFKKGR